VPLVFLDEVDSDLPSRCALLLPLLWDGELSVYGQLIKLGRCIILCSASSRNLGAHLENRRQVPQADEAGTTKIDDFLSRFGAGILEVGSRSDTCGEPDKLVNLIPADSIKTVPAEGNYEIRPDERFLSLTDEWNAAFVARFESYLQQQGTSADPLRFHILTQDREQAQRLWSMHRNNIGLLRLSDDRQ